MQITDKEIRPAAGELQLHENRKAQQFNWYLERLGWAGMALALAFAALGGLGHGSRQQVHVGSADGQVVLQFNRFARQHAPDDLRLYVKTKSPSPSNLSIAFPREFMDRIELDAVHPEPIHVRAAAGQLIYDFAIEPDDTPGPFTFRFKPDCWGRLAGSVQVTGRADIPFSQFVYP